MSEEINNLPAILSEIPLKIIQSRVKKFIDILKCFFYKDAMPLIKANDINLYYETYGKGEPLVLVCGFALNHLCWRNLIAPLAEHFQVIVFDNRGTGQTDIAEGNYSTKMLAEDIIGLLDALNIESAHFMGESMGTLIIQQLCIDHRDRVRKAILCAPFAYLPRLALYNVQTQLKLLSQGFDIIALTELNIAWFLSNSFVTHPEKVKQFMDEFKANPYPTTLEGLINQADVLKADLRGEIKNIPHPVLLLVGELDIDTPPYCAETIKNEIPNCQMHVFKGMGHMFSYEIPEKTVKQALHFLLQQ